MICDRQRPAGPAASAIHASAIACETDNNSIAAVYSNALRHGPFICGIRTACQGGVALVSLSKSRNKQDVALHRALVDYYGSVEKVRAAAAADEIDLAFVNRTLLTLSHVSEAFGGGVGTISTGVGDGANQLASAKGNETLQAYLSSPENATWAGKFEGLEPATPAFNRVWREIASADGVAFAAAQDPFMDRTKYRKFFDATAPADVDLRKAPELVIEFAISFANQPGGAAKPTRSAIATTLDRYAAKTDAIGGDQFWLDLTKNLYGARTTYIRTRAKSAIHTIGSRVTPEYTYTVKILKDSKR